MQTVSSYHKCRPHILTIQIGYQLEVTVLEWKLIYVLCNEYWTTCFLNLHLNWLSAYVRETNLVINVPVDEPASSGT